MIARGVDVAIIWWPKDKARGATAETPCARVVGVDVGKEDKLHLYPNAVAAFKQQAAFRQWARAQQASAS